MSTVTTRFERHVLHVCMSQPEKKNALTDRKSVV